MGVDQFKAKWKLKSRAATFQGFQVGDPRSTVTVRAPTAGPRLGDVVIYVI
jgi:hypothetical protein